MSIEFQVNLSGTVAENAKKAADALMSNGKAAKILSGEMSSLETKMAKAAALGNMGAFKKLETDLEMMRKSLAPLKAGFDQAESAEKRFAAAGIAAGESMKKAEAESKKLAEDQAELAKINHEASAEMMGIWGEVAKKAAELGVAVVAAFTAIIVAGAALAIQAALAKDKLLAMFSAMGGGGAQGARTVAMLDKLGDELGVTRESLVETTKAFEAMGITDLSALRAQILAVKGITAVMGEEGANAYEKLIAKTQEAITTGAKFKVSDKQIASFRQMGLNIDDIAKKMGMTSKALEEGLTKGTIDAKKFQGVLGDVARSKFGEALKEQALEPENLWAKFKENIAKLFDGVKVKPFLEAIQHLIGLFSSDKASGKAMKAGITATFDAVFTVAKRVVDWLSMALPKVEIFILKAMLAMKPWVKSFEELNAKYGIVAKLVTGLKLVGIAAGVLAGLLAAPFAIFFAVSAAVVTTVLLVAGAIFHMGQRIGAALASFNFSAAMTKMSDFVVHVGEVLLDLPAMATRAAGDFIAGLAGGIASGALRVVDAAKRMAQSALEAVTGAFQSHSPSIVMRNIGKLGVAGGLALGIVAGTPEVAAASSHMAGASVGAAGEQVRDAAPPQATAPAAPPPWQRGGSSGSSSSSSSATENHFHFAPGSLAVHGAGKSAEGITEEMVALVFERYALEQGL